MPSSAPWGFRVAMDLSEGSVPPAGDAAGNHGMRLGSAVSRVNPDSGWRLRHRPRREGIMASDPGPDPVAGKKESAPAALIATPVITGKLADMAVIYRSGVLATDYLSITYHADWVYSTLYCWDLEV